MIKKLTSILIMFSLLLITFEIITSSKEILESVFFSFNIWKNNIFPSLFPFFVISAILVEYGFIELASELFKPLINRCFRLNSNCAFIFIMSIISGFPSNAKYTKELLDKGLINEKEATKVLTFTHFSNPLFILGTVSILFLNNKEAGLLILLCHYITNLIIAFIFRFYYPSPKENIKVSFKKAITDMHMKRINNNKSFGTIITDALNGAISTLLLVLGTITMFLVITTIINQNIHLNTFHQGILNGIFEMTQGLKYISLLHIPLELKSILITMILSFGGISVHMQTMSILSKTSVKYLPFLVARIIHAIISGLLVYFLFDFWLLAL